MKTASVQHTATIVNDRIYASYEFDYSNLTTIYTYIMKKLTNVSPFLLLLVPVFMMMVFTITTNTHKTADNTVAMKSKAQTELAVSGSQFSK